MDLAVFTSINLKELELFAKIRQNLKNINMQNENHAKFTRSIKDKLAKFLKRMTK